MSERILLFIPCYNCASQIGRVLAQLRGTVGPRIAEVLVLDNGSTDDTVARAIEAAAALDGPPVTIARNRANYHLGGSHKAAFAHAEANGFSHVIVLHGDDQARLDDIGVLLDRGEHNSNDALLGARFMAGSQLQGYSLFRRFGNAVFNLLFSLAGRRRIHDMGSGLNLFARSVFADPAVTRAPDDLRFNNFTLLMMIDRRRRLSFFPISWREEDQLSNVRMVSQSLRLLTIVWDYVARRRHFRNADHRDRPVAAYEFETLWQGPAHG